MSTITTDMTDRYVAVWNEPDADRRRAAVEALWTSDGVQVLQPPAEILAAAAPLGFDAPTLEARGHDELETRVRRSYEAFVAPGEFTFVPLGTAARLRDVVRLRWQMVAADGGAVAGTGLEVLLLGPDGRIRADYQFIES